jgi:CheY-like chemotaxis protein
MIARSLTPEIEIQYSLADPLWDTLINPGELQDAVLNLIINARDAMPDGGHLFIQTSNIHLDINHTNYEPHIKTGDYVELLIGDTGSGISKENLDHIFEPFFSTKPRGQATGLGLAMIYAFVKRNSGYINIKSEENKGTTFYLYFPRETVDIDNMQDTAKLNKKLPCGTETILIVDDEADLAELASTYLNALGYKTIQAVDTEHALQILETHKNLDLLFSDIIMPGNINGYQLAETALQLRPDIKILLTSGFTSRTKSTPELKRLNDTLLKKPYLKADLAKAVRKSLDS